MVSFKFVCSIRASLNGADFSLCVPQRIGLIVDKETQEPVPNAYVVVEGINKNITSTERGEYWRLLVPGKYNIQSFADGYYLRFNSNECFISFSS